MDPRRGSGQDASQHAYQPPPPHARHFQVPAWSPQHPHPPHAGPAHAQPAPQQYQSQYPQYAQQMHAAPPPDGSRMSMQEWYQTQPNGYGPPPAMYPATAPPGPNGHASAPRQRTAIACKYCRRRKIRCSGFDASPDGRCHNCRRFQQQCIFTPVSAQTQAFVPAHAIWNNNGLPPPMYGAYGQPLPMAPQTPDMYAAQAPQHTQPPQLAPAPAPVQHMLLPTHSPTTAAPPSAYPPPVHSQAPQPYRAAAAHAGPQQQQQAPQAPYYDARRSTSTSPHVPSNPTYLPPPPQGPTAPPAHSTQSPSPTSTNNSGSSGGVAAAPARPANMDIKNMISEPSTSAPPTAADRGSRNSADSYMLKRLDRI